ncbi:anaphase promoting complex subunit DOC1 [Aspergillus homomorphus CBS 101889]|uniref:Galactose-binding like protein n=1 Tax=Aspergillus homomorphus (strain CBS 101889) TaxID=1450537 RepID=A0A395I9G2_ASPHC|nr:galactose-binding like protein [Aspergillus homomorphus CBS 101889]RAL16862.1 galactose-binding like protein [Aspergillus homomorphus CBS 101889]
MPRHHHILRRNHNPDTSSPSEPQHLQYQQPQPQPQQQRQRHPPPVPARSLHRTRLGHHHESPSSQFTTPPSRGFPIPTLHPSSGPIDPDHPLHSHQQAQQAQQQQRQYPAAAAAAQVALFSLFGRGVHGRGHGEPRQRHPPHDQAEQDEDDDEEEAEEDEEGDEDEDEDIDDSMQQHQYPHHLRRRHRHHGLEPGPDLALSDDDGEAGVEEDEELGINGDEEGVADEEEEEGVIDEEDEDMLADAGVDADEEMLGERDKSPTPLPANLREISSLASWTVSTHKPGCGVSALRHPSPTQYWQSDGPQPHTLTLHFFKLVAVVRIRVYLDFEMDESYTPTKMVFLAGMGGNDLVEFATWEGEGPCGWVDVELEGVGGRNTVHKYGEGRGGGGPGPGPGGISGRRMRRRQMGTDGTGIKRSILRARKGTKSRSKGKGRDLGNEEDEMMVDHDGQGTDEESLYEDAGVYDYEDEEDDEDDDDNDPYAGNVLKAMVIQMRVIENHQNGKDTHVRGFQVFARDDERKRLGNAPSASADGRVRRHSARRSLRGSTHDEMGEGGGAGGRDHAVAEAERAVKGVVTSLEEPDWMGEPVIR